MYVYILFSKSLDKYYTGQTNNLKDRLNRHNSGYEKYTRKGTPWELVWSQSCKNRRDVVKRESRIKRSILKNTFYTTLIYYTTKLLNYYTTKQLHSKHSHEI